MSTHATDDHAAAAHPERDQPADPGGSARRSARKPLAAAKAPLRPGAISLVGPVLVLVLAGIGVVGVQAALVGWGLLSGTSWLGWSIAQVQGLRPAAWMLPAGAVAVLAGVWLVGAAGTPRPRQAVAVQAATGVFLRPRDLARIAQAAAEDVDGVTAVRARSTRSTLTLTTTTLGGGDDVRAAVTAAVTGRLTPLQHAPKVSVRTHPEGGSR